ncbi:hypothetical protein BDV95DRAFT_217875 [Massariosphaeria phaeospora]|uniref:Uncharacterized protein n=1 Tax=Massariosphaeria phaeospora TaxID=100035 RepID=A0A7C8MVM8_9PLEO|nr:hypothetical protein BDV95DRAFT_217875 [Massariosphaeria phaeospora]
MTPNGLAKHVELGQVIATGNSLVNHDKVTTPMVTCKGYRTVLTFGICICICMIVLVLGSSIPIPAARPPPRRLPAALFNPSFRSFQPHRLATPRICQIRYIWTLTRAPYTARHSSAVTSSLLANIEYDSIPAFADWTHAGLTQRVTTRESTISMKKLESLRVITAHRLSPGVYSMAFSEGIEILKWLYGLHCWHQEKTGSTFSVRLPICLTVPALHARLLLSVVPLINRKQQNRRPAPSQHPPSRYQSLHRRVHQLGIAMCSTAAPKCFPVFALASSLVPPYQ